MSRGVTLALYVTTIPMLHLVTLLLSSTTTTTSCKFTTLPTTTNATIDDRRQRPIPIPPAPTTITNAHQRSQPFTSADPRRSSPSNALDEADPAPTNALDRSRTGEPGTSPHHYHRRAPLSIHVGPTSTVDERHHHHEYPPAPIDERRRQRTTPPPS
jgi:hypothetical protein